MENTFHMLLYRTFHAHKNYLRPYLGGIGLCIGQPKLLTYLSSHGPCMQRELAEYFEVDRAAVSRMLDSLEKGGFLVRRADESNRRAELVELTEKGRAVNEMWLVHCREMEEAMLRDFSDREKEAFAEYLSRAYRNLKEKRWEGER